MWSTGGINSEIYQILTKSQKVNHFSRSTEITRKDCMYSRMARMQAMLEKHFRFIPQTFIIQEYTSLLEIMGNNPDQIWIVKPSASSQGKGIFLTNGVDEINLVNTKCGAFNYKRNKYVCPFQNKLIRAAWIGHSDRSKYGPVATRSKPITFNELGFTDNKYHESHDYLKGIKAKLVYLEDDNKVLQEDYANTFKDTPQEKSSSVEKTNPATKATIYQPKEEVKEIKKELSQSFLKF